MKAVHSFRSAVGVLVALLYVIATAVVLSTAFALCQVAWLCIAVYRFARVLSHALLGIPFFVGNPAWKEVRPRSPWEYEQIAFHDLDDLDLNSLGGAARA